MLSNRLLRHFGAAAAAAALASGANAAIVVWTINAAVPANVDGLYIKIDTQQVSGTSISGWDLNPYGSTSLNFFASSSSPNPATTYVRTQASGGPSSLAGGTVIGPSSQFTNSTAAVITSAGVGSNGWTLNAINYFGFRFHNNTTNAINYGYGAMQVGANAATRTLLFIEYGDAGESVTVVPAPGAVALLGLVGLVGRRRR
jgi:MYXO-CTERM domain-containing protein